MVGFLIGHFIPALLRVELHAEKGFLLRWRPAKRGNLLLACARVELKKKLLIIWREWLQLDVHCLQDILRQCSTRKLTNLRKFFVLSSFPIRL